MTVNRFQAYNLIESYNIPWCLTAERALKGLAEKGGNYVNKMENPDYYGSVLCDIRPGNYVHECRFPSETGGFECRRN